MGKKKKKNALDFVPVRNAKVLWSVDEEGTVTVEQVNKGPFNWIAQKAFHRPKISYIKLESYGSFIWTHIDDVKTIYEIASELKEAYGEDAEPLYERILTYFKMLRDHEFIQIRES